MCIILTTYCINFKFGLKSVSNRRLAILFSQVQTVQHAAWIAGIEPYVPVFYLYLQFLIKFAVGETTVVAVVLHTYILMEVHAHAHALGLATHHFITQPHKHDINTSEIITNLQTHERENDKLDQYFV